MPWAGPRHQVLSVSPTGGSSPPSGVAWDGIWPSCAGSSCEATVLAAGATGGSRRLARCCWRKQPRHVTELQPRAASTANTLLCRLGAARSAPPPSPSRQETAGSHPHYKEGEPLPPRQSPVGPTSTPVCTHADPGDVCPLGCKLGWEQGVGQGQDGGQQWHGLTAGSAGPKPWRTQPHICPSPRHQILPARHPMGSPGAAGAGHAGTPWAAGHRWRSPSCVLAPSHWRWRACGAAWCCGW